jgi:hypothetical protein
MKTIILIPGRVKLTHNEEGTWLHFDLDDGGGAALQLEGLAEKQSPIIQKQMRRWLAEFPEVPGASKATLDGPLPPVSTDLK